MDYSQGIAFGMCKSIASESKEAEWIRDEDAYYRSASVVDFSKVRDFVGLWTVRLASVISWLCSIARRRRLIRMNAS